MGLMAIGTKKKKGIIDLQLDRHTDFERNIPSSHLRAHMVQVRREVAFFLNK